MRVVQAGDGGLAGQVDDSCLGAAVAHDLFGIANLEEAPIRDGHGGGGGIGAVAGVEAAVEQDE